MADDPPPAELPPLISLLETLELLLAQAQAYEAAFSAREAGAQVAVARLAELTQKALNEAREVSTALLPQSTTNTPHSLSPRELEVLTLAAQGLTNKEIAYRLGLSERTVQFHMNGVFNKTATNSRTEAVALALKNNWLTIRR